MKRKFRVFENPANGYRVVYDKVYGFLLTLLFGGLYYAYKGASYSGL